MRIVNPSESFRSKEEKAASLYEELGATPLVESLRKEYSEKGQSVERKPVVEIPHFLQRGDALGCVIACYRMVQEAQTHNAPSQAEGRQILERAGFVEPGGASAQIDRGAIKAFGVQESYYVPSDFGETSLLLSPEEQVAVKDARWPGKVAMALQKENLVVMALPMGRIYKTESSGAHAIVLYGARYDGSKLQFLIRDPLSDIGAIDADALILGRVEDEYVHLNEGQLLAVPVRAGNSEQKQEPRPIIKIRPSGQDMHAPGSSDNLIKIGHKPTHEDEGVIADALRKLRDLLK